MSYHTFVGNNAGFASSSDFDIRQQQSFSSSGDPVVTDWDMCDFGSMELDEPRFDSSESSEAEAGGITVLPHLKDDSKVVEAMKRQLKWPSIEEAIAGSNTADYRPRYDPSRPSNDQDRQLYVLLMIEAAYDMSAPEDNPKLVGEWQRTLDSSPFKIEAGMWRLLDKVVQYHARPGFLGEKAIPSVKSKFATFAEHVDALCEVFRREKTICRKVLREETLVTFCDDPYGQEKHVRNNRETNGTKKLIATYNSAAIKNLKDKFQKGEDAEEELQRLAEEETPSFRKRKSSTTERTAGRSVRRRRGEKTKEHENTSALLP